MMRATSHLLILTLCCLLSGCVKQKPEGTFQLSYATPYPPGHPFSQADQAWMASVTEQSQGRITFRPYWAGSIITSDMSMLEIRHGLADIGLITPIYTRGGSHTLRVQAGFYGGVASVHDQVMVYECLAAQFPPFNQELEGLKVLAVQGGNFPGVLTRDKPIKTLEDFKGLRLRGPSETLAVLERLGADPVSMPMADVYSALTKGVIDGVVAPADTIYSLHFAEVAQHFSTIRFSRGAYPARAMSMKTWQQLPPDLQQILQDGKPLWERALIEKLLAAEKKGVEYGEKHGITFYPFPQQQQNAFNSLYNEAALAEVAELKSIGIEAGPIFLAAQTMINAGSPVTCAED